jgi:hypothetical protein
MNSDPLRNEITRQWALLEVRRTTVYGMHPGEAEGGLASLSLHEHGSPREWLHFRTDGTMVQYARAGDEQALDLLEWTGVEFPDLDALLRGFLEGFERRRN